MYIDLFPIVDLSSLWILSLILKMLNVLFKFRTLIMYTSLVMLHVMQLLVSVELLSQLRTFNNKLQNCFPGLFAYSTTLRVLILCLLLKSFWLSIIQFLYCNFYVIVHEMYFIVVCVCACARVNPDKFLPEYRVTWRPAPLNLLSQVIYLSLRVLIVTDRSEIVASLVFNKNYTQETYILRT